MILALLRVWQTWRRSQGRDTLGEGVTAASQMKTHVKRYIDAFCPNCGNGTIREDGICDLCSGDYFKRLKEGSI